jgi:hypothetical protein
VHFVLTNLNSRIINGEDYKSCNFRQSPVTSYFVVSNIFLSILFWNTVSLYSSLRLICCEAPNFAGRKRVNLFVPRWQKWRQETLDRMMTGPPWIWSALNFPLRANLVCQSCSQNIWILPYKPIHRIDYLNFVPHSVRDIPVPIQCAIYRCLFSARYTGAYSVRDIPVPIQYAIPVPIQYAIPVPIQYAIPVPIQYAIPVPIQYAIPVPIYF